MKANVGASRRPCRLSSSKTSPTFSSKLPVSMSHLMFAGHERSDTTARRFSTKSLFHEEKGELNIVQHCAPTLYRRFRGLECSYRRTLFAVRIPARSCEPVDVNQALVLRIRAEN